MQQTMPVIGDAPSASTGYISIIPSTIANCSPLQAREFPTLGENGSRNIFHNISSIHLFCMQNSPGYNTVTLA